MKNNKAYSFRKLLLIVMVIAVMGAGIATAYASVMMSIEAEIGDRREPTDLVLNILVWTDKEVYSPADTLKIGLANPLNATVNFEDNAYSLRIERLVNGTWLKILPIYDPSSQADSFLPSITESRGQVGKIIVTFQLPSDLAAGRYRVISDGKTVQNGATTYAEGSAEFEIS
jgi:hypothetical protein